VSDLGPVDPERMRAICGQNESLAIELIGLLVDEATPIVSALGEHVRSYRVNQVNELAHALKGIAGTVGALELRDAAMRLEAASDRRRTPASNALDIELTAISHALEHIRIMQRCWQARAAENAANFVLG
jgi:HPt (histidine-containing phosphotransfer) domain-containing protein